MNRSSIVFCLLLLASSTIVSHADEYMLTATSSLIANEPSEFYHTGGPGVSADVQIGSTNSYMCMNVSGRTLTANLTYTAIVGIYALPGNPNKGFVSPLVQGHKQVILANNEGWTLSNVLAGTTEPLAIGGYYCYGTAALTEDKTGDANSNNGNSPQLDVTVEQ